ncbi:hypothetical protein [Azotobacter vinelandii]
MKVFPNILNDGKEKALLGLAALCFVLLIVVKVKLPIAAALDNTWWHLFFASNTFEEISSDILAGLIAAYIFYLFIDLLPRSKRESTILQTLNLLIASIIHSYEDRHFFGHEIAITDIDVSKVMPEKIDRTFAEVEEKGDFLRLKCALFTAHSRIEDFRHALTLATYLSPEHAKQWLVVTDKVRLFVGEYEQDPISDDYDPAHVFGKKDPELDRDALDYINYATEIDDYRQGLQIRLLEFLEQSKVWIALKSH